MQRTTIMELTCNTCKVVTRMNRKIIIKPPKIWECGKRVNYGETIKKCYTTVATNYVSTVV